MVSDVSFVALGRAHSELFMIRQIANQISLGMWLANDRYLDVMQIAKTADKLIGELMEAYDKQKETAQ